MQLIQQDSWQELLQTEQSKEYWSELINFVEFQYQRKQCFPPRDQIFKAFELTALDQIKVVILGQDPYHGQGQAHGLAFSVPNGVVKPPSLINILKEVHNQEPGDIWRSSEYSGNLTPWAEQGVFLLNSILTVEKNKAGSHQKKGWEHFTDAVIRRISQQKSGVVFMLWGRYAQRKIKLINPTEHLILTSGHPSPLSANRGLWFGCDHFNKANHYLEQNKKPPILW